MNKHDIGMCNPCIQGPYRMNNCDIPVKKRNKCSLQNMKDIGVINEKNEKVIKVQTKKGTRYVMLKSHKKEVPKMYSVWEGRWIERSSLHQTKRADRWRKVA